MKHISSFNIYLIFCVFTFSAFLSNAQQIDWAAVVSSSSTFEYGIDSDIDSAGNLFIFGHGTGNLQFDTNSYNVNGGGDAFIAKLSPTKQLLWFKTLGGDDSRTDEAKDIHVDHQNNVILTLKGVGGNFTYNGDTLTGINAPGQWGGTGVIIKIDNHGNYLWHDHGGAFEKVTTDTANNIYLTGWFSGMMNLVDTFQLINTAGGTTDMLIAKYSPTGNLIWAKNVGGAVNNASAFGNNIAIDKSSSKIFVLGRFSKDIYFNTGVLLANASYATFLVAYDSSGMELWHKSLFNNSYSYCQGLGVSMNDVIGVAGFNTFGSNPDGLIGFYDLNGTVITEQTYDSPNYCRLNNIEFNQLNEIYVTGIFGDHLTIGISPSQISIPNNNAPNYNGVIIKLNSNYVPIWAMQRPASFENQITCKNNRILYSGRFDFPFAYNNGIDTLINNLGDAVFAELFDTTCSFDIVTDSQSACFTYTWIDGNTYTTSNSTATDTFINSAGCDSIVFLNLEINSVTGTSTSVNGFSITANNTNATSYQWLRCDSNYSPIINETGQSFTAVQDGSYAVQINENGCIDTSNCVSFENVSINDIKKQARFSVYPTATAKYIYVDFHDICNEIELVVMDVNGKTVNKVTQKSAIKTQIELKGAKGLYYLTIKSNCGQRTFKVVKIN